MIIAALVYVDQCSFQMRHFIIMQFALSTVGNHNDGPLGSLESFTVVLKTELGLKALFCTLQNTNHLLIV